MCYFCVKKASILAVFAGSTETQRVSRLVISFTFAHISWICSRTRQFESLLMFGEMQMLWCLMPLGLMELDLI